PAPQSHVDSTAHTRHSWCILWCPARYSRRLFYDCGFEHHLGDEYRVLLKSVAWFQYGIYSQCCNLTRWYINLRYQQTKFSKTRKDRKAEENYPATYNHRICQ